MEVIEHQLTYRHSPTDKIDIYPLGDVHAGSIHCNEKAIKSKIQEIKDNPKAYWIGMGDMVDAITKNDKRFDIGGLAKWVEPDNIIESQRRFIVDLFKPIAPRCLGYLTGNHEEVIHSSADNDISRNICKDLNVPYAGYSCFINLHFRRNAGAGRLFTIHAWHGSGAAQQEGARIMRLMRLVNDVRADIYLMGHLHAITKYNPDQLVCTQGRIKSRKLIAVMTGSWLTTYTQPHEDEHLNSSYGEQKGYKPSRLGCPVIHIFPESSTFTEES